MSKLQLTSNACHCSLRIEPPFSNIGNRSITVAALFEGSLVVAMKNPPHPGRFVRQECLEPLELSVTAGARVLGVTRQALNNVVNEKAAISAEMAVRIAKAFGGSPELWLRLQTAYDLSRIPAHKIRVKPYCKAS
jgi:antitoxin HigA-1